MKLSPTEQITKCLERFVIQPETATHCMTGTHEGFALYVDDNMVGFYLDHERELAERDLVDLQTEALRKIVREGMKAQ